MDSLYDKWAARDPEWEIRYQEPILNVFCDYGKGTNKYNDARGKLFGAGYEMYIIAFFIGLYYDQTKPLVEDKSKRKSFGWSIQNWGHIEARNGRLPYNEIRQYIFAALIARTDIDFIALDKGEITPRKVVDDMITKMEQYANWGFDFIKEKLEDDPNYFFKETAFLRIFLSFVNPSGDAAGEEDDMDVPESLD
jgi:hypothetical protein